MSLARAGARLGLAIQVREEAVDVRGQGSARGGRVLSVQRGEHAGHDRGHLSAFVRRVWTGEHGRQGIAHERERSALTGGRRPLALLGALIGCPLAL